MKNATTSFQDILNMFPSITRSCNDVRHCSRCFAALTDPASWERGIGPICAKKDTALFARTVPANFSAATLYGMSVVPDGLPLAIQPIWAATLELLMQKNEKLQEKNEGDSGFYLAGEDYRPIVKIVDFMLSFVGISTQNKTCLIQVVKSLGYPGLAGVLAGKSSTGEATLKFENGLISLTGSKNKAGWNAMRKIPGVVFPKLSGRTFTCPAKSHKAFVEVVMEYWPCFEGDVPNIIKMCEEWIAVNPQQNSIAAARDGARVVCWPTVITLDVPWVAGKTPKLVEALKKNIQASNRSYVDSTRTWVFRATEKASVLDCIKAAGFCFTEEIQTSMVNMPVFPAFSYTRGRHIFPRR